MVWAEVKPVVFNFVEFGDRVEGKYVRKLEGIGPNKSNAYIIRTSNGEVTIWGTAIIDDGFSHLMFGDEVRVTYNGTKPSKSHITPTKIFIIEKWVQD